MVGMMSNLVLNTQNLELSVDGTSLGSAYVPYENQIIKVEGDVILVIDDFEIKASTLKELIIAIMKTHPEIQF